MDHFADEFLDREFHELAVFVSLSNDFTPEQPDVVAVCAQCLGSKLLFQEMKQERFEAFDNAFAWRNVGNIEAPAFRPVRQVGTIQGKLR